MIQIFEFSMSIKMYVCQYSHSTEWNVIFFSYMGRMLTILHHTRLHWTEVGRWYTRQQNYDVSADEIWSTIATGWWHQEPPSLVHTFATECNIRSIPWNLWCHTFHGISCNLTRWYQNYRILESHCVLNFISIFIFIFTLISNDLTSIHALL